MKVCLYPLHNVDSAPMTLQWHGRTTVCDHLPCDKLESAYEMCFGERNSDRIACQCAAHGSAEQHARGTVFVFILKAGFSYGLAFMDRIGGWIE